MAAPIGRVNRRGAVAVPRAPSRIALSISGPATRMTDELVARAVPLLTDAARRLSDDLASGKPQSK